jgi:tetratricopeptide (TPR) repeat protein
MNGSTAMDLLKKAEDVLQEKHTLPKLAQQQELALILRERAARTVREGKNELAAATLKRLQELSDSTHDQIVQIAYEGAAGAVLFGQGKYEEALTHLSEDMRNPLSLLLMLRAYQQMGDKTPADELSTLLANWNEPTLEHALVVTELHARHTASAGSFMRM